MARLGHIRVLTSYPMLRPWSERPKSNAKSLTEFLKKIVSANFPTPAAASL